MLNYILPFIVLILIVVFIHEYGHYYFAKKYGVGVTDFSIGFGKEIFGWNDKSGTRWKICWIPLGGYVKFFGDRNVYSQADHKEILEKYNDEEQKKLLSLIKNLPEALQKQLRLSDITVLKQIIFDDLPHYTFLVSFLDQLERIHFCLQKT